MIRNTRVSENSYFVLLSRVSVPAALPYPPGNWQQHVHGRHPSTSSSCLSLSLSSLVDTASDCRRVDAVSYWLFLLPPLLFRDARRLEMDRRMEARDAMEGTRPE